MKVIVIHLGIPPARFGDMVGDSHVQVEGEASWITVRSIGCRSGMLRFWWVLGDPGKHFRGSWVGLEGLGGVLEGLGAHCNRFDQTAAASRAVM